MKRIKRFSISKLFGYKDVDFDFSDHDTIIFTGLNGAGKSHVLKLLHGCLTANADSISKINFESAEVTFDDNSTVIAENSPITRYRNNTSREENQVYFYSTEYSSGSEQERKALPFEPLGGEPQRGPSNVLVTGSGLNEIHMSSYNPSWVRGQFGASTELNSASAHRRSILIDTDRLFIHPKNDTRATPADGGRRGTQVDSAEVYLKLLRFSYDRLEHHIANKQAKLQSNLSNQMIGRMSKPEPAGDSLQKKYRNNVSIIDYCKKYQILLDENVENAENIIESEPEGQSALRKVFDLIYDNQAAVVGVAMPFAKRIELLLRVLNLSFSDSKKMITIGTPAEGSSSKEGVVNPRISFINGYPLDVKNLSSGEKHLLAIYITVAVSAYPGSAVFIDEPEISLHPRWQIDFLDNLKDFAQLIGFQLFVATHSPTIVGDNWQYEHEVPMVIPSSSDGFSGQTGKGDYPREEEESE